ncbi:MAG: hypothetical protein FWD62_09615 [Betaproteobacteria bacterium]|nr:hypothetical protein [Betaproteobacteria bacterium]
MNLLLLAAADVAVIDRASPIPMSSRKSLSAQENPTLNGHALSQAELEKFVL